MINRKKWSQDQIDEYVKGPHCSYYGSLDDSVKPKFGVSVMLVEEHLKLCIDKACKKASDEFASMNETCRKGNEKAVGELAVVVKKLSGEVTELSKLVKFLIKENDLKAPIAALVEKKKLLKQVVKDEDDEEND